MDFDKGQSETDAFVPKTEKTKDENSDDAVPDAPLCGSQRLLISGLGFFCFLICLGQRASMSVAIVCMMNQTAMAPPDMSNDSTVNSTSAPQEAVPSGCGFSLGGNQEPNEDGPFLWTKPQQGYILSSFFLGYFITQFPIGIVAEKVSPKWVFSACFGTATVANLLTPVAAQVNYGFLLVVRILAGMGTSATFPCMHAILSRWSAPYERSRLTNLSYSGVIGGAVVGNIVAGVLCKHGFGQRWDSIFYVLGSISVVAWILWMVFVTSGPEGNRFAKEREIKFLASKLEGQNSSGSRKGSIPVKGMVTSGPVWAIVAANFCSDWGLYTIVANIPTFLNEVHYFDIQSNGMISALPFIGFSANMYISPIIADKLMSSKVMSPTVIRKVFNTVGMVCPAIFLIGLSFIECTQPVVAIVLLTLAGTLSGCYGCGFLINHIEIAPKYAGTLVGITNGIAGTSGFIAPTVASLLTPDRTRRQWQNVFFLASGIYVFGAIIYAIFASAEIQPWAREELDEVEMEEFEQEVKA